VTGIQLLNYTTSGIQQQLLPGNIMVGGPVPLTNGGTIQMPVLATATSNSAGMFSFNVPDLDQFDFGIKQVSIGRSGAEFAWSITGSYRMILMVRVTAPGSNYYMSPLQFVTGIPADKNIGTFYCKVRTVNADVKVVEFNETSIAKDNMEVMVLRKNNRPNLVPRDEITPGDFTPHESIRISGVDYEIIAKKVTNGSGVATFNNLVQHPYCQDDWPYYIFTQPKNYYGTVHSVHAQLRVFKLTTQANWNSSQCYDESTNDIKADCIRENCFSLIGKQWSISGDDNVFKAFRRLSVVLAKPRAYALVKNQAAGTNNELAQNEENANWYLWRMDAAAMRNAVSACANGMVAGTVETGQAGFNLVKTILNTRGTPMVLERYGSTGSDGRINETSLPTEGPHGAPTGYFYVLQVVKTGFESVFAALNKQSVSNSMTGDMAAMPYGLAYDAGTLWLKPKGEVKLILKDANNNSVAADAYYIDPATGQSGNSYDSYFEAQSGGGFNSVIKMDIPSGNNRKIVIEPSNTEKYAQDTITVDVPENGILVEDVIVPFNLHRIYFNVKDNDDHPIENVKIELITELGAVTMFPGEQSPYLYEGASSQMPHNNTPTPIENNNNNNSGLTTNGLQIQQTEGAGNQSISLYSRRTNNGGGADFAFTSSAHQFLFRLTGPNGSNYVVIERNVFNYASKNWKRVNVKLVKGRTVRGTVKFGQQPVAGARVRVVGSSPLIEVFTNNNGEYEMMGVPTAQVLTFSASKPNSNYVGMEYTEGQNNYNVNGMVIYEPMIQGQNGLISVINFKLRIYDGLDLSRLLGFPLEVTSLVENTTASPGRTDNSNTSVTISGLVTISDSLNTVFKMDGTTAQGAKLNTIDFSNIVVVADAVRNEANIPFCRPRTLPVKTDVNEQAITIHQFYAGRMYDNLDGITLNSFGTGAQTQGVAQAKVIVDANSVNDNNFAYLPGQEMYLQNGSTMQFPVFNSNGNTVVNASSGIPIINKDNGAFAYQLRYGPYTFTVNTNKTGTRLYKDSILLDSKIQTNLDHVSPANLNLSIGKIKIGSDRKLKNTSNTVNETRQLGSFSMNWKKIYFDNSGISFDGMLTAAGIDMPVTRATLYNDHFHIGEGSLSTTGVKLLGTIPVTVKQGIGASFGYDGVRPVPAWYLSITSGDNDVEAAAINSTGMSGLPANSKIPFSTMWFYSDNTEELTLMRNIPSYRLHNITDFSLQSVILADNMITLNGLLDMGIPAFTPYNTGLIYEKQNDNTLAPMKLRAFSMQPMTMNGIVLSFNGNTSNNIQFTNGSMQMRGSIGDESPNVFTPLAYTITKTSQQTELTIDRNSPQQTILGGNSNSKTVLSDIEGKMSVTDTGWNHFYFKGDMPESMGFTADGKRMRFDVSGALQVKDQSVKLKKVSSDFAGLNMTYDMANHRLMGQMDFNETIGATAVEGHAEMVFDRYGYYFMADGSMEMHNPSVNGATWMIFGDYDHLQSDRLPYIEEAFRTHSYYFRHLGKLPSGYTNMTKISGFFFEAGAAIPFPGLPNFDIDLGLVQAALEVQVGGDVRMGIQFGDVNMYNMGMGVFVDARFAIGVSFIHACAGVELEASAGVDMDGNYWSNGDYTLKVTGFINLKGYVWAGGGLVCDSDCDGLACGKTEARGTLRLAAVGTVTDHDSSFRIEYGANTFPREED
jgi:hypothetical protein